MCPHLDEVAVVGSQSLALTGSAYPNSDILAANEILSKPDLLKITC